MNQPTHITRGDVLDDLGFSRSEASALKIKATILEAILAEIDRLGLTQRQLVDVLDEYQPNVSSLLHGRISQVSIEKLLHYADRLRCEAALNCVHPASISPNEPASKMQRLHSRGITGSPARLSIFMLRIFTHAESLTNILPSIEETSFENNSSGLPRFSPIVL